MRNVVALFSIITSIVRAAQVTLPSLDLSSLGHVAVAGQFSGISLYQDTSQTALQTANGHDALFVQEADNIYRSLGQSDGLIYAICALNTSSIFVGGNFSTIGNVSAVNVASYSPATGAFSALSSGVVGTVNALYCSNDTNQVYIGGNFELSNSTNVVIWDVANQRFEPVPFEGLDGSVDTIQSSGDSLLFGGQFDSVYGASDRSENGDQQINLQTAYVRSPACSLVRL